MKIIAPAGQGVAPEGGIGLYRSVGVAERAFGVGVGAATRHFGDTLSAVSDQISQDLLRRQTLHNETVVNDTYAGEFSPKLRELYQGYYSLQGKDAVTQRPEYEKKMQDTLQETRDKLTNPEQQRNFDAIAKRRLDSEFEGMGRHANAQDEIWQGQVSDATLKNAINDAADKYNDETAFGTALGTGLHEIDRFGTRPGKTQPAEVLRARADEFISKAWTTRIQSAAVHDPLLADQLYQDNKKDIAAAERPVLERQLKNAVMPVQAKQDAMAIIAQDVPRGTTPSATQIRANQGKWMAAADKIAEKRYADDPIYRDLLQSQVSSYVNRIAGAEEAVARNARNAVMAAAIAPTSTGEKHSDLNELLATPALKSAWDRMEPPEQLGVLNVLKAQANPEQTPEALASYHELRGLAANDPAGFSERLKTELPTLAKRLPHEQMLQLINQDTSIAKNDVKQAALVADAARIHRVTDGQLQQAGFKLPKRDEKDQKVLDAYQNFTSRMLDATQEFYDQNKHKPSDVDLRAIAQRQLIHGYEAGTGMTWFGYPMFRKEKAAFEGDANFAVPAPPDEIPKIRAAYVKVFKRNPSADEIDRWYAARLLQKGTK